MVRLPKHLEKPIYELSTDTDSIILMGGRLTDVLQSDIYGCPILIPEYHCCLDIGYLSHTIQSHPTNCPVRALIIKEIWIPYRVK